MPYGLSEETVNKITSVLARYPEISTAVIYGSRAKGTYRPASDIDITLIGDGLTHDILLSIEIALDDLLLPYKIDLSLHSQIENVDLLGHIERVGIPIINKAC
ncbi:nucleotidyltransferase domain-containing protein [Alkalimarinus coralli]|uniref:nucleotidyltransferase domain-containing protein n=1 Tax=Alkalimarinus coralli TaxID=2935863 RepID=UPI00202B8A98|nr:nucleotidyltransferase domain-containing protein [Alkalimarinus coralli]